jgi:hypothetical protein
MTARRADLPDGDAAPTVALPGAWRARRGCAVRAAGIDQSYVSHWSSLSPIVTNPACYDLSITDSSVGGSWGTYIFFGGPGGFC